MTFDYRVFVQGKAPYEVNKTWAPLPGGAYVQSGHQKGNWYYITALNQAMSINKCDLPDWVKAYLLLLGES